MRVIKERNKANRVAEATWADRCRIPGPEFRTINEKEDNDVAKSDSVRGRSHDHGRDEVGYTTDRGFGHLDRWTDHSQQLRQTDRKWREGETRTQCGFAFAGKRGNSPVTASSTVTLKAVATILQGGLSRVLRNGDKAIDTFGNTVEVTSARSLTTD